MIKPDIGILASTVQAKWKDCPTIDTTQIANVSSDGLNCSGDTCALKCADGYSPSNPKKTKCIEEDDGWTWNKSLGSCVTCKDVTGIEDDKVGVNCKVNSSKKFTFFSKTESGPTNLFLRESKSL